MKRLKTDFEKGKGLVSVPAEWLTAVANFINELEFVGGRIERHEALRHCKIIPGPTESGSASIYSFQVFITGADTVGVCGGYCGFKSNADVAKEQAELTITESSIIYLSCNLMTGEFSDFTHATTLPQDTANTTYYPIATVIFSDGAIRQIIQRQLGDIYESGV